jgi:hypothetical protein
MKKILIVMAATLIFNMSGVSQVKKFQQMIGSWEIVSSQDPGGKLEIIDSSTIVIRFMGEEKKLLQYKFDFSKSPFWFDFTAKDSASVSNFKSLIEFVNDDTMRWQIFIDEERPDHFSSEGGEVLYLKRSTAKPAVIAAN